MKTYCIGKSIVLTHVRYVNHGGHTGMMFHSEVLRTNSKYQTLGCDKIDVSGFCFWPCRLVKKNSRKDIVVRQPKKEKQKKALRFKKRS